MQQYRRRLKQKLGCFSLLGLSSYLFRVFVAQTKNCQKIWLPKEKTKKSTELIEMRKKATTIKEKRKTTTNSSNRSKRLHLFTLFC